MRTQISVIIITRNEESCISRCLESIAWADEIVVVDDMSTDRTMEICREYTDHLFTRTLTSFAEQKNYAASRCTHDWVFSIDADEYVPEELREEIQHTFEHEPTDYVAFNVLWKNYFLGKWMRYGGWYGYNTQGAKIFRKDRCSYEGIVHEKLRIDGKVGRLQSPLVHYGNEETIGKTVSKMNRYTDAEVDKLIENDTRPTVFYGLIYRPLKRFIGQYLYRRGYKDGAHGFISATFSAMYQFLMFAKYWERQTKQKSVDD